MIVNIGLVLFAALLTTIVVTGILASRGNGAALTFVQRTVTVERAEISAMLLAALYFFCTLMSYSMLRPVRDEIAVASGVRDLPKLFLATLVTMIVITPVYGALVARFPVRKFVRISYQFVALNLVAFFVAYRAGVSPIVVQWTFFAWLTVWAVFGPSVFWAVMADTFSSAQAKRLFGFIGVGGTVGFIAGSYITSFFTRELGVPNLMLISGVLVLVAAILAGLTPRVAAAGETMAMEQKQQAVIGGSPIAGAVHVLKSPYLAAIAGFLFLYVVGSTVLYAAQTEIVGGAYTDRGARTEFLARIDLTTQLITAFGQMFLTARLMRAAGLGFTLSAVSVVSILGFVALGLTGLGLLPALGTFIVFTIARRASEYMLTQPSRKVLFTVLAREDKYKATNFLETFVYRAGDQIAIWGFAGLVALGLALPAISWIAAVLAIPYFWLAIWLARRQKELASGVGVQDSAKATSPHAEP